jgi:alpha-beta hydrolase superfamily lysophospholipase
MTTSNRVRVSRFAPIIAVVAFALTPGVAAVKATGTQVQYGATSGQRATIYSAGSIPLLLLHEKGLEASSLRGAAAWLASQGFTVFNLDWNEPPTNDKTSGIFPSVTDQTSEAIGYVQSHARKWHVDSSKLVMVGGSRGALIALLDAKIANDAVPGTVKVAAALSGQVDPAKGI